MNSLSLNDDSVVRYGFDIVRSEAKKGTQVLARYPGQWYEPETEVRHPTSNVVQYSGLHYNWHRYYDPNVGRYITPDPLGLEAGMNLYAYAGNDPVHNIDPDGLDFVYWYWFSWNNRSTRWIPHVGIQIVPSSTPHTPQKSTSVFGSIFFDWAPPGQVGLEQNYEIGNFFRFKASSDEDICIMKKAISHVNNCKKTKSSPLCKWGITYNCFHWVEDILKQCNIHISYNKNFARPYLVRRPISTGRYEWNKLLEAGRFILYDPFFKRKLFVSHIKKIYGSNASKSIQNIIERKTK